MSLAIALNWCVQLVVGCSQHYNVCQSLVPVRLEFNKNPLTDHWDLVQPLCLPDSNDKRSECRPHIHHDASIYTVSHTPTWTRVTIDLPEKTHSRWVLGGLCVSEETVFFCFFAYYNRFMTALWVYICLCVGSFNTLVCWRCNCTMSVCVFIQYPGMLKMQVYCVCVYVFIPYPSMF